MQVATPVAPETSGIKNNRIFVLSSLSVGHGLSHMFDQGFPLLLTEIAAALGLGSFLAPPSSSRSNRAAPAQLALAAAR